jgi:sirohydrochlorin cobaltochelatase
MAPFEKIRQRLASAHPEVTVTLAFLELMQPDLEHAVDDLAAKGVTKITLIPLFLAQGGHLKKDLPELLHGIAAKHTRLAIRVTRAIGEVETIIDTIAEWTENEYLKDATK